MAAYPQDTAPSTAGGDRLEAAGEVADRLTRLLARARSRLSRLQPAEARDATARGARLVDIRPEFQRRRDGEIAGAIVIERNHLEWRLHPASSGRIDEACDLDVEWIILCDEGYASSLAAATLRLIGLRRATDIVGGFQAWRAEGLPVDTGGPITPPRPAPPGRTS